MSADVTIGALCVLIPLCWILYGVIVYRMSR